MCVNTHSSFYGIPTGGGEDRVGAKAAAQQDGAGGPSEKDAKLAQKLGQPQAFMAVFLLECMGQLAYFGPA